MYPELYHEWVIKLTKCYAVTQLCKVGVGVWCWGLRWHRTLFCLHVCACIFLDVLFCASWLCVCVCVMLNVCKIILAHWQWDTCINQFTRSHPTFCTLRSDKTHRIEINTERARRRHISLLTSKQFRVSDLPANQKNKMFSCWVNCFIKYHSLG